MKKSKPAIVLLCLLLLTTLLLGGCSNKVAEQMSKTIQKMDELTSLDARAKSTIEYTIMGQPLTVHADLQMSEFTNPLRMKTTATSASQSIEAIVEEYMIQSGDTISVYVNMNGEWTKQEMRTAEYEQRAQSANTPDAFLAYLKLLKNFTDLGEDTSSGKPLHKYQGLLDGKALGELMADTLQESMEMPGLNGMNFAFPSEIDGVLPFQLWVDPETDYLVRLDMDLSPVMQAMLESMLDSMDIQLREDAIRVDAMTLSMNFENFNNATEFTLPDEAKSAASGDIDALNPYSAA